MPEEVLHTDRNGYEVIRDGDKVTCRGKEYTYLSTVQAAELILRGEKLERYYIEALTVKAFRDTYNNLMRNDEERERIEGAFEDGGRPKLNRSIVCYDCLIGSIDLGALILDGDIIFKFEQKRQEERKTYIFGEADFGGVIFRGDACFFGTTFNGKTDFQIATFNGCASFTGAIFNGYAYFRRVDFNNKTVFAGATFNDYAYFRRVTFDGETDFGGVIFNGKADFELASFNGDTNFGEATFNSEAHFEATAFNDKANFEFATFNGYVFFLGTAFRDKVGFLGTAFRSEAHFLSACFLFGDFSGARFEKTCYMNPIVAGRLNLHRTVFTENLLVSIYEDLQKEIDTLIKEEREEEIEIRKQWIKGILELLEKIKEDYGRGLGSVNFEDTLIQGELRCEFKHIIPEKGEPVLLPHKEKNWAEAQKQYAWLKEQYRRQGSYGDEDKAHRWASECARCAHRLTDPRRYLKLIFYKWVAGYGVKPWNVVGTICIVFLVSTLLFGTVFYGELRDDGKPLPDGFWERMGNALYFSGITYATIGYGDIRPVDSARLLAVIEGILGIVLNAALVVVLFRKLIR